MDDLITFLRARLREIELAIGESGSRPRDVIAQLPNGWAMTAATLMVEVESKRQILDYFQAWLNSTRRLGATETTLVTEFARQILTKLALPFATHPDYRREWRP